MPGPPPGDFLAQLQARQKAAAADADAPRKPPGGGFLAELKGGGGGVQGAAKKAAPKPTKKESPKCPPGKLFQFDADLHAFLFDHSKETPCLVKDQHGNEATDIFIPLAPCMYRLTDYTFAQKEPVELDRCIIKLGVLRCLARELKNLNGLLWS